MWGKKAGRTQGDLCKKSKATRTHGHSGKKKKGRTLEARGKGVETLLTGTYRGGNVRES